MIKKFNIILLLIAATFNSNAGGDKFGIKGILSPTFETMRPGNRYFKDDWGFKLSYNFGMEYKFYFKPDVSLSTGVLYHDKGYRSIYSKIENPDFLYSNSVYVISYKYILVPTNLNLHFEVSKKSRLLIVAGMSNGYLIDATGTFKRVSEEQSSALQDQYQDLDVEDNSYSLVPYSNKRYTGVNLGFKFSKYIRSKMIIEFGAIYGRQLNRIYKEDQTAQDPNGVAYVIRPKFDSIVLDVRLGYFFNKQIKNSGEF